MLDENQIASNWETLIKFIEDSFTGDRKDGLLKLHEAHADRIAAAPASNRIYFHSSFIGGYVYHVLNVIRIAQRMSKLWNSLSPSETYTEEELNFVALNHDLGKIGDVDNEYYIPNTTNDWKYKHGSVFDFNENIPFMKIQDRSLFLLQHYGVKVSHNEYVGITTHDGLYDDGNKAYYVSYDPKFYLRTMLPYVIHFADMFAFKHEYYEWLATDDGKRFMNAGGSLSNTSPKIYKAKAKKKNIEQVLSTENTEFDVKAFNELFPTAKTEKSDDN